MFTFTNPFLLWAFPILILPWIFRRRQEDRVKKVEFPLIRFLMESEEKDLINPRLQEFLLLILRTLLLLLLLLALAGPKWTEEGGYTQRFFSFLPIGKSVQSSVVVIDSSYSLGYGQGESSWWSRSSRTAERVAGELAEFNTSWVWWNQASLGWMDNREIQTHLFSEIKEKYEEMPAQLGTSITDLIPPLQNQFTEQERIILITDGQRDPWRTLLENTDSPQSVPPMLVIPVGEPHAKNAWVQMKTLTQTPWGIGAFESAAGVMYGINTNESGTLSVYDQDTGESIYSQSVQFSLDHETRMENPFQFDVDVAKLIENPNNSENPVLELNLAAELESQDGLVLDNKAEFKISVANQLQLAVAYDPELQPVELRFITAALQDHIGILPLTPENPHFSEEAAITIIAEKLVPWWTTTETMQTLEYIKNGGKVLLFAGAKPGTNSAWNNLLEELGWTWSENTEPSDLQSVSVSQSSSIYPSLAIWDINMWDAWQPAVHGKMSLETGSPAVSYNAGNSEYHLIAEANIGKGKLWLVNANLQSGADNVWSPILPYLVWGTIKEAVRTKHNLDPVQFGHNMESDLTVLSEEEKTLLQETYGIQFAQPDEVSRELRTIYGGLDLRYVLLMLTIFTALVESWLSNRLASL